MTDGEVRAQFDEIRGLLAETMHIQREQARTLLMHSKIIVKHDERMERIGRHLEMLIDVVDGLIRDGGKKKK